jgi:predicted DNA-binding transcriptional regulator AlpA
MNNRREPTLAFILEEVRQLREEMKARDRALLTVRQAAVFLGMAEKSLRNRVSDGSFPLRPVRLSGRPLFKRRDLEDLVDSLCSDKQGQGVVQEWAHK